jgi:hypothetical protein
MLAQFMITKENFYGSFTTADAAATADNAGGGSGSSKKRTR